MKAWGDLVCPPISGRSLKPRTEGYTMVIDKGLGLRATQDLVEVAAEWIDDVKLTFGTSCFYEEDLLRRKIEIIRKAGVEVMPGGTYLEIAVWQGVLDQYLEKTKELGFSMVEVSDGTIPIAAARRANIIKKALALDLKVITEVGKKDPRERLELETIHEQIASDLAHGAFKVIIEAREAGKGVGIYDDEGRIKEEELESIVAGVADANDLLWEAPLKQQQQYLIFYFGINVNLGNVYPEDVLALEALRQGLRGDTLKRAYLSNKQFSPEQRPGVRFARE